MQLKPINMSLRTCTRGPLRCFRVYKSPPTQPTSYIAVMPRSLNLYAAVLELQSNSQQCGPQ